MPGVEWAIEDLAVRQAKKHGWLSRKLSFVGVRGATDRIFGKGGRCVVIEFKRPGKEPTLQQERRHKELREAFGLEVHWCDNYEDACAILGVPA